MRATSVEYRLRFLLHGLIFLIGFWPVWEPWLGLTDQTVWQTGILWLGRAGWLSLSAASNLLLGLAIAFAVLGALLRVWGAAYVGAGVVKSPSMHGERLLADGPYRHTRNPLYLGTLLHTFAVALIMPPAGAVFAIAAVWVLQVRLALAEEAFLAERFGQSYGEYRERVPRFLPSPKPLVQSAGARPHWVQAVLGEAYVVGAAVTLAGFGWEFNHFLLLRGILISLGVALVVRAFLPRAPRETANALA